jgi:SAM-dependent methyltransferase
MNETPAASAAIPAAAFGTRNAGQPEEGKFGPYSGIGVLEIMSEAANYNRYLTDFISRYLRPGIKAVDFGAGAGTFALPLVHRGIDLICVEPDALLKSRLNAAGTRAVSNLGEIADASVDLIYTLNVLEHIADHAAAVRQLASKLKPGGKLLIYVPAFQILYSSFDLKIGHLRRYKRLELCNLVSASGLRLISVRYADSLGFIAAMLYRALGRDDGDIDARAVKLYDRYIFPVSRCVDVFLSRWLGKNLMLVAERHR